MPTRRRRRLRGRGEMPCVSILGGQESMEALSAIHARHHEIGEHEIRGIMLARRQGIPAVLSEFHAIASGREKLPHDTYDRVVIVDDEDTGDSRATVTATSPL